VRITQGAREATCGQAEMLPREDRITLTENPVLIDHAASATAAGDIFTLRRAERRVGGENVRITLPPLPDLGAKANKIGAGKQGVASDAPTSAPSSADSATIIRAVAFAMWQPAGDALIHATFDNNVRVTATNLTLVGDHLELTADPAKPKNPLTAEELIMAQLRHVLATGRVHFTQLTREAYCDRAEIFPQEDRITLTGKPVITDSARQIVATGDKLTLIRGQQDIQGENIRITTTPAK